MKHVLMVLVFMFVTQSTFAGQSTILEASGKACMGDDKSRKQTEQEALLEAKRKAVEFTLTRLTSETEVKNFQFERDLVEAYAHASIRIIQEIDRTWYKDDKLGECYRTTIKAEVIPDEHRLKPMLDSKAAADPRAPLYLNIWADKPSYVRAEKIKIYILGNKPFFGRVVYRNAAGHVLQVLPNPYRKESYFNAGMIYELPSHDDRYDIEVIPPFGKETITVYGSTVELGEIEVKNASVVYEVKTKTEDIGIQTRGVQLIRKSSEEKSVAEFSESCIEVETKEKK